MIDSSVFSLEHRVAIVTGGGSGIGRGIALAFASAGADVIVASRNSDRLDAVCKEIGTIGRRALAVPTDITDEDQVSSLVRRANQEFGQVDVLVNNAGAPVGPGFKQAPLLDLAEDDFMGYFDLNVKGAFLCCREVVPIMNAQKRGVIINVASMGGKERAWGGWGPAHMAVYGAAKAALIHLTMSMAVQWAPHVRVNCINPGSVSTDASDERRGPVVVENEIKTTGMQRLGTPDDIAAGALYLASDAANWISGTSLDIYGGNI